MSNHELVDEDIVGFGAALQKLLPMLRYVARQEFWRAIFEDGYAEIVWCGLTHFSNATGSGLRSSWLCLLRTDSFVFDLFIVRNRGGELVPVVGRVYPDSSPRLARLMHQGVPEGLAGVA